MNSHHTVAIGTWEGDKQQSIEYNSSIAVGIDCPRAKLRVSILLDTIQEYQVRYIFSDEEISEAVNEAGFLMNQLANIGKMPINIVICKTKDF